MTTFKTFRAAGIALDAAKAENPSLDLVIQMDSRTKVITLADRPDHLKKPSKFDDMQFSDFMSNCSLRLSNHGKAKCILVRRLHQHRHSGTAREESRHAAPLNRGSKSRGAICRVAWFR